MTHNVLKFGLLGCLCNLSQMSLAAAAAVEEPVARAPIARDLDSLESLAIEKILDSSDRDLFIDGLPIAWQLKEHIHKKIIQRKKITQRAAQLWVQYEGKMSPLNCLREQNRFLYELTKKESKWELSLQDLLDAGGFEILAYRKCRYYGAKSHDRSLQDSLNLELRGVPVRGRGCRLDLSRLDLTSLNGLNNIHGIHNVVEMDLYCNKLNVIKEDDFNGLTNLRFLRLVKNRLVCTHWLT